MSDQIIRPRAGYTSSVTITRTADTATYGANDIIGAATGSTAGIEFTNIGPNAGHIMITSVELMINSTGVISGETSYTLHLYSITPPSALGDQATWDLPSGDRASYLGFVNLGTPLDVGSTLYVQTDSVNKQIKLASNSLFGYLVTVGTYASTSNRVHIVKLNTMAI